MSLLSGLLGIVQRGENLPCALIFLFPFVVARRRRNGARKDTGVISSQSHLVRAILLAVRMSYLGSTLRGLSYVSPKPRDGDVGRHGILTVLYRHL